MLALNFNLVELIDPDDRKISDLLALLLNPKETHAQAEKFLEKQENVRSVLNLAKPSNFSIRTAILKQIIEEKSAN